MCASISDREILVPKGSEVLYSGLGDSRDKGYRPRKYTTDQERG